jgi:hypothetical protein
LDEYRVMLLSPFILFGAVPTGIVAEDLPASFSVACGLGRSPRTASDSGQAHFSNLFGRGRNAIDGRRVAYQRFRESELGAAALAGVVHGCNGTEIRPRGCAKLKQPMEERENAT